MPVGEFLEFSPEEKDKRPLKASEKELNKEVEMAIEKIRTDQPLPEGIGEEDIEKAFENVEAGELKSHLASSSEKEVKKDEWITGAVNEYLDKSLSVGVDPGVKDELRKQMLALVKRGLEGEDPKEWAASFEDLKPDLDALNPEV